LTAIGASLPEFELLGYNENKQAFYIRCPRCVSIFKNPMDADEKDWAREWLKELEAAEAELKGDTGVTAPSAVKMKAEPSEGGTPSTVTTQPDETGLEMDQKETYTSVMDLQVREVIVID